MNNKNTGGKDAEKNRSQGTSINRQDEQQAQQARDSEDPQQGGQKQNRKPNQDQGARH
jgi:hypothetical protein